MPIHQDQFLTLLAAAKDYRDSYQRTLRLISQDRDNSPNPEVASYLTTLYGSISVQAAELRNKYHADIELADKYYTPARLRANDKNREEQRQRRRNQGVPIRAAAPSPPQPSSPPVVDMPEVTKEEEEEFLAQLAAWRAKK